MTQFEADLDPATGAPRVRFNFSNGWSASLVLQMPDRNGTRFALASIACCPAGRWGKGETELLGNECGASEAGAIIAEVCMRAAPGQKGGHA